jgi:hypothetical protein
VGGEVYIHTYLLALQTDGRSLWVLGFSWARILVVAALWRQLRGGLIDNNFGTAYWGAIIVTNAVLQVIVTGWAGGERESLGAARGGKFDAAL